MALPVRVHSGAQALGTLVLCQETIPLALVVFPVPVFQYINSSAFVGEVGPRGIKGAIYGLFWCGQSELVL